MTYQLARIVVVIILIVIFVRTTARSGFRCMVFARLKDTRLQAFGVATPQNRTIDANPWRRGDCVTATATTWAVGRRGLAHARFVLLEASTNGRDSRCWCHGVIKERELLVLDL
jgi:hypothetical protein